MASRRRILPEFLGVVVFGVVLYAVMMALQGRLESNQVLFSFETWSDEALGNPLYRFLWFIGDFTEAEFYKSLLGGIGILLFALLAHVLDRANSRWKGFPISYGTGLWPWILAAALIGLGISVALYGNLQPGGLASTFVPFVSVPAGVIFIYGRGWDKALTGGILGGLITFPIAWLLVQYVLTPLQLPPVIGNVTGMWLGAVIVFELCRYLPWMNREEALPGGSDIPEEGTDLPDPPPDPTAGKAWFSRRVLAEFSEAQFYGNELASAGLILGTLLSWVLNPLHPAYGSGLLPAILLAQILTASIAILIHYDRWREMEWYPTFVPLVSVAPATVLAFGGTVQSILAGAILGAIAGPPVAQFIINRLPGHWHLFIGNTFSMAICTLIIVSVLRLLPGFELV